MPDVRVEMTNGASVELREAIDVAINGLRVKVLNKNHEYTSIVIDEVDGDS